MRYRVYVTDSLQALPQHKYLTARYADKLFEDKREERSGEEIAADVINRAGLNFDEDDEEE